MSVTAEARRKHESLAVAEEDSSTLHRLSSIAQGQQEGQQEGKVNWQNCQDHDFGGKFVGVVCENLRFVL